MSLSEIRVNTTKTRTGVGTITYTETGPVITGIATASNFKTGSTNVHSTGVELANINTGGSTATFGGPISGTTASFSGNVSIGGTLTYEDVTNIDSVGIITARDGVVDSTLTAGRVVYVDSDKSLTDSSNLTFNGTALSVTGAINSIKTSNNYILIGSSNAGGASLVLDGDSNGDGGGTDYAYIEHDTSGNLNIVGDNPANAANIIFKTNSSTERLRITSDGKVLVGDGSAITQGRAFEVRGTGNQGILVGSTNNNGAQLLLDGIGGGDGSGGNYAALEVPTSGHLTIRNHDADKNIIFGTGSASGANDTVVITDTQRVGINVADPAYPLEVSGDGGGSFAASSNSTSGQISIVGKNSGGSVSAISRIKSEPSGSTNTSQMVFETRNSSNNMVERFRINSDGRVGVKNNLNYAFNTSSNTLCIGDGGGAVGLTIWTAAGADSQNISFHCNETLSRAEGEISYGPVNTTTTANRNAMMFRVNSGERVRITSAGKVLIGTITPQGNANADDLVISTSATTGITIRSGTGNSGNIFFADGTSGGDEYRGWVTYNHGNENLNFGVNAGERLILNQYATLTLESGSQGANSKPGIELKSTGYTGNITRLFQDSPNASSILETTERSLVIDLDSGNQVSGTFLQIDIDNSEQFRFDPSSITYQKQNTRGILLAPLDYHNNTNHYIDLTQWRVSDNWNILEVFGTVNPNSSGSGAYADPVHMYIYRGTGWDQANTAIAHWVYCASVAPPSRHAFPSGTGYAGNTGISAVWYTGSSVRGNKSSTSTDYVRLQIPNANGSNSFVKNFRVMRRF